MKDWKKDFLESFVLGPSTNKQCPEEVVKRCIELAYSDMMTAGRYYSASFLHTKDEICFAANKAVYESNYVFSRETIKDISSLFCDEIIGNGNRYVTGFGLAQKLINITYKYLYVFSDMIFTDRPVPDFSVCDCPLDSIIIKKLSIKDCFWSKITEQQYLECQAKITELLKENSPDSELSKLGNLAYDFINWKST
ncbi:MAG: hypothetical protein PUB20_04355 [Clostridia bacterium]|nr:hypothetical protein [Clostridia bacterium]